MRKIYPLLAVAFGMTLSTHATSTFESQLLSVNQKMNEIGAVVKSSNVSEARQNKVAKASIDESEWTPIGEAIYKDSWVFPMFGEEFSDELDPVVVNIMKHNTIEGEYLLVNPYMNIYSDIIEEALAELGVVGYGAEGYIRFNISNPDCVYVHTQVGSGAFLDLFGTGDLYEFFNYNSEGYYIDEYGYTTEEIIELFDEASLNLSYFDGTTAYIYNSLIGLTDMELANMAWHNLDGTPMLCIGEITFDPNGGTTAVDNAIFDNNAPIKYYNIQGVEISNPEKGQLVIKKQGNKTTKFIVK